MKEAIRLMNVATQRAATDPRTGRIDMDMIATGRSAATRESLEKLQQAVADLLAMRDRGKKIKIGALLDLLKEQSDVEVLCSVSFCVVLVVWSQSVIVLLYSTRPS